MTELMAWACADSVNINIASLKIVRIDIFNCGGISRNVNACQPNSSDEVSIRNIHLVCYCVE